MKTIGRIGPTFAKATVGGRITLAVLGVVGFLHASADGQTILGKHPADKVLAPFFAQNDNANTLILNLGYYGTVPWTLPQATIGQLTLGGVTRQTWPTATLTPPLTEPMLFTVANTILTSDQSGYVLNDYKAHGAITNQLPVATVIGMYFQVDSQQSWVYALRASPYDMFQVPVNGVPTLTRPGAMVFVNGSQASFKVRCIRPRVWRVVDLIGTLNTSL